MYPIPTRRLRPMPPDHTTNTLGLLCPLPLLFAVRDMTRLDVGQTLELVGDDPGLLEDIPSWCAQSGHVLREVEVDEGVIVCRIEKGTRAARRPGRRPEPRNA